MEEEIKLDMLGLTRKELNDMQNYVEDYKSLEQSLDRHYFSVEDKDLKETIIEMQRILTEYEESKYKEYKEKIEEYEDFNINDYVDNDAIASEYRREIMGGLK